MVTESEAPAPTDSELALMALVARKHYHGGLSKSEIASQLYLSRFKVARLLEAARIRGIVTFQIALPGDLSLGLAEELRVAYRLRRAVVLEDLDEEQATLFSRLGAATTMLLAEVLREGDTVGVASTRTMMGLERASVSLPRSSFIQLTGALPRDDAVDVISTIRGLTQLASGSAQVFYAPMVASSTDARDSYLAQPETRAAFARHPELTVFITGIGDWSPGLSLIYDALPPDMCAQVSNAGAVAEILGVPIDSSGRTVHTPGRDLIVAPDVERLSGARDRIAVVFDPQKAPAVKTALDAGIVNTIVTHHAMAEALLAL